SKAKEMITHLSSLAESRVILSFAPKTPVYTVLKKIGSFFPGPSKATRAYLHAEKDVVSILESLGWKIERKEMNKTQFYFSRLIEAVRS
ncbi:MAG: magnesium protoporphyrin IX methyltransferase, partial [Cyanobacteria bacterium J06626_4]